ncbi:vesicular glutamate transporter 3-like [Anthonomus grandis grandis]|uniref:vesicular glutamate transporter 3-like n=1 Tax=Anthonomus grandis grandis TaxID=2921223 RepID=UPI002165E72B|nr:vesicular glutamate transporter 3-like [Anthonomus grandis grandis]
MQFKFLLRVFMMESVVEESLKAGSPWLFWRQKRYVLALLVFFANANMYTMRTNLSISIVAMTQDRINLMENGTVENLGPEFAWTNIAQGYLLSSFFYGFICTPLLGGWLSKKYGGKFLFGGCLLGSAIISLLCPWLARWNYYAFLVGRVCVGLLEGLAHSSNYRLWSHWIPPVERTRIVSQALSGNYVGNVFSMMFFGFLVQRTGWESSFWFSGALGIIWFIFFWFLVSDTPATHPSISKTELNYIQTSINRPENAKNNVPVPWKHILTSKSIWAYNIVAFCETWGYFTLMTLLPKYFKDVFKIDVFESGILSALPYIYMFLMMSVSGITADIVVRKHWLSLTNTRKCFIAVGFIAQAVFMMVAANWGTLTGTVVFLVLAVGTNAFAMSNICAQPLDIAPNNASIIMGLCQTVTTLTGILSPTIAGYIVSTEDPRPEEWNMMFYIASGTYFIGLIVFFIFGKADREKWDSMGEEDASSSITKIA